MLYIMVTNFEDHWDRIPNTTYTVRMFRQGMNEATIRYGEEVKTIFIKRNQTTHAIEKCWIGRVKNFSKYSNKKGVETIKFDVLIDQNIDCPVKYKTYVEGWYYDESECDIESSPIETTKEWDPQFFKELLTTTNYRRFEELTHKLLKIMGIHDVYPFPPERQRGIADGFFRIRKLAVIYDSTLESNWEQPKAEQVNNYCAKLKSGRIDYQNQQVNIPDHDKQVWIITRGTSCLFKRIDEIDVREISIDKLIEIHRQRMIHNLGESQLEGKLRN